MRSKIDIFNGDADGLCALHQVRLAYPVESILITGPKREIGLLGRVDAKMGDEVLVLDVSLSKNRAALDRLLKNDVRVLYFDHHQPGDIPQHPCLETHIDTSPDTCTSLLVNDYLSGKYLVWAVTAAFGDNLAASARHAATALKLREPQLVQLKELGECLNYNGYGETLEDLYYDPAELYRIVHRYEDPFDLIENEPAFRVLKTGYAEDMVKAMETKPSIDRQSGRILILPAEKWARRISGVYGNLLATQSPAQAHAVLTRKPEGGYVVSVRAPMSNNLHADEICSQFETGGGRKGAAGINHLPDEDLDRFERIFYETYHP
jgi:single-stranded DNA-specific DHH superfamily exonuclease